MSDEEKKKVLVVDDIGIIIDAIKTVLNGDDVDLKTFHWDPTDYYLSDKIDTCVEELYDGLKNIINEVKPHYICFDVGYSVKVIPNIDDKSTNVMYSVKDYKSEKVNIKISEIFDDSKSKKRGIDSQELFHVLKMCNNLKGILIYTFNPFDNCVYQELDYLVNKIKENLEGVEVDYIETSASYNKPRNHALYKGWYDNKVDNNVREIGTVMQLKEYGSLVGEILRDYLMAKAGKVSGIKSYNDKENIDFLKYKRTIADKFSEVSLKRKYYYKLGSLAYYDEEHDLMIDVPYKPYYPCLDDFIEDKEILSFFTGDGDNGLYKDGLNYIYYKLDLKHHNNVDCGPYMLKIADCLCYEGGKVRVFDKNLKNIVNNVLKLCFSSVYNVDYSIFVDGEKKWGTEIDNQDYVSYKSIEEFSSHGLKNPIYIYYFYHKVESHGVIGSINYSFYSDDRNYGMTAESDICGVAKYIYDNVRPMIEAKVLNAMFPKNLRRLRKAYIISAISQVMARNMSHNIGSHVMSKFKDEKDIVDVSLEKKGQYIESYRLNKSDDLEGNKLIAYFNEYLKNRMDFLADIATSDPVMETPMYLFRDIMRGFDKNRILLNRISGVSSTEEYQAIPYKIVIAENGNPIEQVLDNSNDPLLSIPNDILGAQAFYILLENIIRNIYKHGNPEKEIKISIEAKDYEKNDSFYEISIYDNIPNHNLDNFIANRNAAFNKSIIDENKYTLRPNNLGTIEMSVCAAYLRCLPISSVEDAKYKLHENNITPIPRLIYAFQHKLNDKECSLGYKLCVSKPKEILVVAKRKSDFIAYGNGVNEKEFAGKGVDVVSCEELKKSDKIYNHQILFSLLRDENIKNIIDGKHSVLPKRIVFSDESIISSLKTPESFIDSVWEQYVLRIFSQALKKGFLIEHSNMKIKVKANGNTIDKKQMAERSRNQICKDNYYNVFIDVHTRKWADKSIENLYYDMTCGHNIIGRVNDIIFRSYNKRPIAEYIEVVKTKIILLDERIQQNIVNEKRKYGENVLLIDFFEKQKLFIARQNDCDLNKESFCSKNNEKDQNSITVTEAIVNYIKNQLKSKEIPDFVIIHLGVLEKMVPSGEDKKKEKIDNIIKSIFGDNRKRLVITSGRANPYNLPNDILFVPLALVQNAVETLFDKYLLTKILFNTRKKI